LTEPELQTKFYKALYPSFVNEFIVIKCPAQLFIYAPLGEYKVTVGLAGVTGTAIAGKGYVVK
jgi:hypothetical protein